MGRVEACRNCGSADIQPRVASEREWTYHRCRACDFLFLWPRPERPEELYHAHEGCTFNRAADRALMFERRLEAKMRFDLVARRLRPGARIVEVGCGAGHFLAVARDAGHPVVGYELGEDAVQFARETFGLDVRHGTLNGSPEPCDAMVWFNLLSHLTDPDEAVRTARRWLRPGGLLVIETGNVGELKPERYPPLGAPEHLFHFGERSLRMLLERGGFEVMTVDRRNVEWQRAMLAAKPAGKGGAARKKWWRTPAAWLLLTARFRLGRFRADADHFCTMFVFAR